MRYLSVAIATLSVLLGIHQNLSHAEYSIRYLGSVVSDNEQLVDASQSGWFLVKDITDPRECVVRAHLQRAGKVRLCDKGLSSAIRINDNGLVLGKTMQGATTTLAVWGDKRGLTILEKPEGAYDLLEATDLNNRGEVVGFSTKEASDDESYQRFHRAYWWRGNGELAPVKLRGTGNSQALALNDKGETVVWTRDTNYHEALYVGKHSFRRIDRRGEGIYPSPDESGTYSINSQGQISSAQGLAIFSPRSGWRKLTEIVRCDRCDISRDNVDISRSGRALFNSTTGYLSEYPKPAVKLSCLMPQNRNVTNTRLPVQNLEEYMSAARFVNNDNVLFSADIAGDATSHQLFILERDAARVEAGTIRDYCPTVRFDGDKEYTPGYKIETCRGRFTVASTDGPLHGVPVKLFARQATGANCPSLLIDTLTSSASGTSLSLTTDPGFTYYLAISDPRFGEERFDYDYRAVVREGYPIESPISPCRKPLEGLIIGE